MNYSQLKHPGLYLVSGNKTLSLTNTVGWEYVLGPDPSPGRLAGIVGWVWTALKERREMLMEIPYHWELNGRETDQIPLKFDHMTMFQQIDNAMQSYGKAYPLKQKAGRRLVGIRWTDPAAVVPDMLTANHVDGVKDYIYNTDYGTVYLPAEDILPFQVPGMREIIHGTPAGMATRLAADILRGIGEAADTIFDNNAIPPIVVKVPQHTQDAEVERVESRFARWFNRGKRSRERPVAGVREGVEFETVPIDLQNLAMTELEHSKIVEILAVNSVPTSRVGLSSGGSILDTKKDQDSIRFVNTMAQRFEYIASVINNDEDVQRIGLQLIINTDQHPTRQAAELEKAEAIQRLTGNPVLTVNEGRERLGLDPVAGGDVLVTGFEMQPPESDTTEIEEEFKRAMTADAWKLEAQQFKRWYRKRIGTDVAQFKADYLEHPDKLVMAEEILRDSITNYP